LLHFDVGFKVTLPGGSSTGKTTH